MPGGCLVDSLVCMIFVLISNFDRAKVIVEVHPFITFLRRPTDTPSYLCRQTAGDDAYIVRSPGYAVTADMDAR